MNAQTQREEDLFDTARQFKNPDEARAFLARACRGDAALRTRIEDLLAIEADAERFFCEGITALDRPAMLPGFTEEQVAPAPAAPPSPGTHVAGEEPIGARIGRYKLVQKIGEGGCGVVYLAEQEEPVKRQVALKIIKLGMETKSVIARFEAERQALAMMDHPNIAHVFDAGATDRGPPYFVMELVRGVKITDYCDHSFLDTRSRMDLFIQVCHAIQHAHQKGIIHGDIKPSNILVTLHDGVAVPKVIDFGISKATEARLTDRFLLTSCAQLIGTPAYMSPEQADVLEPDIDTRSDIYSLGVLLFELLTGRTPFEQKELMAGGLDEMRRILREKEPPKPSARLGALSPAGQEIAAQQRGTQPAALAASLRGDLDCVVMKALEKDRSRRYETANGLAMDIQRHLDNEPVLARPPSRLYRLQKLVRRNRVVFIATTAVAAALVAGLGTSTWLFLKEREARQRAVAAEQQQAQLRHDAELREKITQAALLVTQERFEEADRLVAALNLVKPSVDGAAVLRSLGEWHALGSRWSESANRLLRMVAIDQLDGWDAATLDLLRCGPALLEAGETAAFEKFRSDALTRFSTPSCPAADRVVKISLLLPADAGLLGALAPLVDANKRELQEAEAAGDMFQASWRCVSLALYAYRSGHYEEAVGWARRCMSAGDFNAPRNAAARIILAMAEEQAGHHDSAQAELDGARELVNARLRSPPDRGTPTQGFWFDWVFARILLRESTASLSGSPEKGRI